FKSGNTPDGLYTSMIGFFMKAGSAIGMCITGIVLSAIGFNAEAAEQAADTIANLSWHLASYRPLSSLLP
ncbi:MFS transporter, partial [[Clostridium] symbiosum]|uniref:MFS transporter n=1 Tax=Clostridium symbiosum TaxID=1512 RepID=UPI00210B5DAE